MTLPSLSSTLPQLQELLEAANTAQKLGPGPQAHAMRRRQQALVRAWEALKLRAERRRTQLERACLLARFHRAVRALSSWVQRACVCYHACGWTNEALQLWRETRRGHELERTWVRLNV